MFCWFIRHYEIICKIYSRIKFSNSEVISYIITPKVAQSAFFVAENPSNKFFKVNLIEIKKMVDKNFYCSSYSNLYILRMLCDSEIFVVFNRYNRVILSVYIGASNLKPRNIFEIFFPLSFLSFILFFLNFRKVEISKLSVENLPQPDLQKKCT
jgi:hypothetical protein